MNITRVRGTHGNKSYLAFTIVELLIVIVVIAILASISVVAYNGIQQRARDSQRKSDLAQIAKAVGIRSVDYSTILRSGDTCTSNTEGFFSQAGTSLTGSTYGAKSAAQCLSEESGIRTIFRDPSGATSCVAGNPNACFVYIFVNCSGTIYIFAHLESEPTSTTATNGTCGAGVDYDANWGMNYYVRAGY